MKRDSCLFATSALGLMLALPYPGSSFARDLPAATNAASQMETGVVVLAQNDEASGESRKKSHGRGEGHEKGHEGGERVQRPASGHEGQAGRQKPDRNEEKHGGQGKREGEGQPRRLNAGAPVEKTPQAGKGHNEPRESGGNEGQGGKAQKPERRLTPRQPAEQPRQAPSGKQQAQPPASPAAPAQQEQRRQEPKNGVSEGRKPAQKPATQNHQPPSQETTRPSATPAVPATTPQQRPAGSRKPQQGGKPAAPQEQQGGNGKLQLPGQNGMQQQRPDSDQQGHRQDSRANGGRPRNAAPVFDSQKRPFGQGQRDRNGQQGNVPRSPNAPARGAAQSGAAPKSDRAAQSDMRHGKIESIDAIKGRRVDRDKLPPLRRPQGADVVKEIGNRTLIRMGTQIIVQNRDQRIAHGARDVYYEDLPGDRRRETVMRPDGSRVITIRNAYGDIIRRSRIMPGGRELVLVYVDDRDLERDRDGGWRDPGADLPPMRLTVPEDDYILDASEIRDPDRYYEFLDQPPVERVPRLYTLGEVKRSARIRDMIPRIDLDTVNFDFGSASIDESEVSKLQVVADAIERILKKNPAETFLIEGHTDAVGSAQSNLVLSDERAEAVATALTNVFAIPPENLTTQGYGEEFLKIDSDGPNRENRRVTIRRITPLVAPVASNQ
jgi:outer membrane protein OmpA-like peptidoglycan-associated protein